MKASTYRDRAFTWIELCIVSATFTMLMALLLPAVQQAVR